VLDAKLQQVERRLHHHFHGKAGLRGAVGYAQSGLMKDDVGGFHESGHQPVVSDIALHQVNGTAPEHVLEVFRPAPDHVVQGYDLAATFVAKQIHDVRADKPGAAGHQNALAL
jgi:hypothetical protein